MYNFRNDNIYMSDKRIIAAYQSPIALEKKNSIKINQIINIHGRNEDATYNPSTKNYEVHKKIILTVNDKKYKLDEYHFHMTSEHEVDGEKYPGEIHYVFIEYDEKEEYKKECSDVCGCKRPENKDILVIGRTINNCNEHKDLHDIQVKVPHYYYEYDGTLTTGNYSPVRWIIGEHPMHFDLKQITPISESARPIQPLDGRIILLYEKK